jgi:hypothetical protein
MAFNQNISAGGMLVAVSAKLEADAPVSLCFRVPPDSGEERVLAGRVVRIETNEQDPEGIWPYRVAVAFDEVDEDLIPYLEETARHLGSLS